MSEPLDLDAIDRRIVSFIRAPELLTAEQIIKQDAPRLLVCVRTLEAALRAIANRPDPHTCGARACAVCQARAALGEL